MTENRSIPFGIVRGSGLNAKVTALKMTFEQPGKPGPDPFN
jgi:hypothetical protein